MVIARRRLCMSTRRLKSELNCRIRIKGRCMTVCGGGFDGAIPCNLAAFCCSDAGMERVLFGGVISCRTPFGVIGGSSNI